MRLICEDKNNVLSISTSCVHAPVTPSYIEVQMIDSCVFHRLVLKTSVVLMMIEVMLYQSESTSRCNNANTSSGHADKRVNVANIGTHW